MQPVLISGRHTMAAKKIMQIKSFRLAPIDDKKLTSLAKRRGIGRSAMIRTLIQEAPDAKRSKKGNSKNGK